MSSEPNPVENAPATATPPSGGKRPIVLVIAAIAIVLGGFYGVRTFLYNASHVSTDDAQVTSDLVQVAPKVSGTIVTVLVQDNQEVKKGDLLAEIDPSTFQTAVAEAQANLAVAQAAMHQAQVNVGLTGQLGNAQILQAEGQLAQTEGAVQGSYADVSRFHAAEAAARAQASGARTNVKGANAALQASIANLRRANAQLQEARSLVTSSRAEANAAASAVSAAVATREKAQRDAERYQTLLKEGVISPQMAEQATTQLTVAQSQETSARERVASAQATIAQRRAEVLTAQGQVAAAQAQIDQSRAAIQASADQASAADAAVQQAIAQSQAAATSIQQAQGRSKQAAGAFAQAKTSTTQVQISQVQQQQAAAKVQQAEAALQDAKLKLGWTKIYASIDGRVSKKSVTVGAQVQIGSPLMAIVPVGAAWVTANFKETQLADVKIGQSAEIEVDAFGGAPIKGHVDSISAGTGATFALLPPDNATGNYTKVVQRVPVKIVFEPGQEDVKRLTVGLSVTASIQTKQ